VDGTSQKRNSNIFVVVALDHAESQVLRGENSGRHLTHVAVAQEFIKVGKLEKQKAFSQDFQVNSSPGPIPQISASLLWFKIPASEKSRERRCRKSRTRSVRVGHQIEHQSPLGSNTIAEASILPVL
jgi:hypothetical protein